MKFLATGIAPAARIAMIPSAMISSSRVKPASARIVDCGLRIDFRLALFDLDFHSQLSASFLSGRLTTVNPQSAIRNLAV
jgi:hypothetical protein